MPAPIPPALREAAYEGLPFRLRRQLHSAVGQALERDLGRDADADPAVLSLHFIRAGDLGRTWKYSRLGAERASARYAHADAAELYRRAVEAGLTVSRELRRDEPPVRAQLDQFLLCSAVGVAGLLLSDCILPVRPPDGKATLPGPKVCILAERFHRSGAEYWYISTSSALTLLCAMLKASP